MFKQLDDILVVQDELKEVRRNRGSDNRRASNFVPMKVDNWEADEARSQLFFQDLVDAEVGVSKKLGELGYKPFAAFAESGGSDHVRRSEEDYAPIDGYRYKRQGITNPYPYALAA